MGVQYENGWGVPKNGEEAVFWYRKAAEQGEPHAQLSLGNMYSSGRVVAKDPQKSSRLVPKSCGTRPCRPRKTTWDSVTTQVRRK